MKLQFKHQQFQLDAVSSVVDLFQGQTKQGGIEFNLDPGQSQIDQFDLVLNAYRNAPIQVSPDEIKERVRTQQIKQHIQPSKQLSVSNIEGRPSYNFSIEMETGTGKTYTYIRTIMELNKQYGWLKFVIVVPSVAIREGVLKSFQVTTEHFKNEYEKQPRFFVYDSKRLGDLDTFANSSDIRVMIINSQAFNATGKDARRIHMEQESFRWRKPIDVLAATHPIMIIDEPQSVEGEHTKERLKDFKPLFTLRYSATHREKYDMVYRLDAMDAYNKKLVKKISVKAIEQNGTTGTNGFLYLQEIVPQKTGGPKARIEFEVLTKNGVKRQTRLVEEPFNLYEESGELEAYRDGWTLSHFDGRYNTVQIGSNRNISVGEVIGDINEDAIRRLQIRETIKSHIEKEERLWSKRIKVLSLFFIDEVAKYKQYDENNQAHNGDYAEIFEEEYTRIVRDYLETHKASSYRAHLERNLKASKAHQGYFSVDKTKKRAGQFINPKATERRNDASNDQDAYDLIMKNKEQLLSFDEPVRFIFSHSALKEGWDNPNVFQICTLKQSSAETRKRQEIGRGMRLAVDQNGIRQDQELLGQQVHDINLLTVIANESYEKFADSLQKELKEELKDRPSQVTEVFFANRKITLHNGSEHTITADEAKLLYRHFIKEDFIDTNDQPTETYYQAKENGQLNLPVPFEECDNAIIEIVDYIYDEKYSIPVENANETEIVFAHEVNEENLARKEFKALWSSINHKSTYQVTFDDNELIKHSIDAINDKLNVKTLSYHVTEVLADEMNAEGLHFQEDKSKIQTQKVIQQVITTKYDLLGEVADLTGLTRKVVAEILSQIYVYKFDMFKANPEDFIQKVSKLINEQKASQIIKHIEYNILDDTYDQDIFYENEETGKLADEHISKAKKAVYNYVKVDSKVENQFKSDLENHEDVKVYVKLPASFYIPTPLGKYNPDWAIAFKEGSVNHLYFVAETKGSMSTLQLKGAEEAKINCARAHFRALKAQGILSDSNVYDVVSSYSELMDIVRR